MSYRLKLECGHTLENSTSHIYKNYAYHGQTRTECPVCDKQCVILDGRPPKKSFDMEYNSMRNGRTPFPCEYCGMRFSSTTSKNKHRSRQHEREIRRY